MDNNTTTPQQGIFINHSNHPSSGWSKEQKDAAERYGKIVDLPFPLVPPELSAEGVAQMANDMSKILVKTYSPDTCVVHVMGEMNYIFALITALKAEGFVCVASTTTRNTEILPNGTKNSIFSFCQFRNY